MPSIKLILDMSDGTILMPLRPIDRIGKMEHAVRMTAVELRGDIGDARAQDIFDWAAIDYADRPEALYKSDASYRIPITQQQQDRWANRMHKRHGQTDRPKRTDYYFRSLEDDVVEQGVDFTGPPDVAWVGPSDAPTLLAMRVNQPTEP